MLPPQTVIVASNVHWAADVEAALEAPDSRRSLAAVGQECIDNLAELTRLIRSADLNPIQVKSVAALVTIDVHNRDIVQRLTAEGVASKDDFRWQARRWEGLERSSRALL